MDFKLTEKAKEKLNEMKNENKLIKLAITGYSWCGAKLGIVSDELEGAIRGAEIDYSTSLFTRGFEVTPIYSK